MTMPALSPTHRSARRFVVPNASSPPMHRCPRRIVACQSKPSRTPHAGHHLAPRTHPHASARPAVPPPWPPSATPRPHHHRRARRRIHASPAVRAEVRDAHQVPKLFLTKFLGPAKAATASQSMRTRPHAADEPADEPAHHRFRPRPHPRLPRPARPRSRPQATSRPMPRATSRN